MSCQVARSSGAPLVSGYARLLRKRDLGGVIFLTVRYQERLTQLLIGRDQVEGFEVVKKLSLGSLIWFSGAVGKTRRGVDAIVVDRIKCEHKNSNGVPDKWNGLSDDRRYRNRALDLMINQEAFEFAALISTSTFLMRCLMVSHGYREFNTGTLQEKFEGGLAEPFSTKANFNGKTYYLSLTSETKLKRLILGGFERVFEIAQTFRNEGVNAICSPEHTLIEAYAVNATLQQQVSLVEELVKSAAYASDPRGIVEFWDKAGVMQVLNFSGTFESVTFEDECKRLTGYDALQLKLEHLISLYPELFTEGMPRYTWLMKFIESVIAPAIMQPTFLTYLPVGMSPFVKSSSMYHGFSERAFFICGGLFIADIYVDEHDPDVLIPALDHQARLGEGSTDAGFINLMKYGLPPTAGFGLGLKRLALLFRRALPHNIKETILFPL